MKLLTKILFACSLLVSLTCTAQINQRFSAFAPNLDSLFTHAGKQMQPLFVLGRNSVNDGFGAWYVYDSNSTATPIPYQIFAVTGRSTGRWILIQLISAGGGDSTVYNNPDYAVIDILTIPPSSPNDQDKYLAGVGSAGAWISQDNDIETWNTSGTHWTQTVPTIGQLLIRGTDDHMWKFTASGWVDITSTLVIHKGGDKYGNAAISIGNKNNNPFWFLTHNIKRGGFTAAGNFYLYYLNDGSLTADSILVVNGAQVKRIKNNFIQDTTALHAQIAALTTAKADKSTTISTTSPLSGGGDLSANRTLSISQANTSTNGYLSSTDWNTFNGKLSNITGLVTAGTNVSITGSGTSGSPYNISSSGSGGGGFTDTTSKQSAGSILFEANNFANTNQFIANGVTTSIVNGYIRMTGTATDTSKNITYYFPNNGDQKDYITYVRAHVLGTGFALSARSVNTWFPVTVTGQVNTSTNQLIIKDNAGATLFTYSLGFTIATDDLLKITFSQRGNQCNFTVEDRTQTMNTLGNNIPVSYTSPNQSGPNSNNLTIFQHGGTNDIAGVKFLDYSYINPIFSILGDSKVFGATIETRWVDNIGLGPRNVFAGSGDRTAEYLKDTAYLKLAFAGKTMYLVGIGRNDSASSVAAATWRANDALLTAALQRAGITVIHTLPLPEQTSGGLGAQTTIANYITATYPTSYIDISTGIVDPTDYADPIHFNSNGNLKVASNFRSVSGVPSYATRFNVSYLPLPSASVTPSQWSNVTGGINYPSGNVGIGQSTPTSPLDISFSSATVINNNSLVAGIHLNNTNSSGITGITFGTATPGFEFLGMSSTQFMWQGNRDMVITTVNNAPKINIYSGGTGGVHLGVNGGAFIHLVNGNRMLIGTTTDNGGVLAVNGTIVAGGVQAPSGWVDIAPSTGTNASINFRAAGSALGGTTHAGWMEADPVNHLFYTGPSGVRQQVDDKLKEVNLSSQTSSATIFTYTLGAADSTFEIAATLTVNSVNGGTAAIKVVWTDPNATSNTAYFFPTDGTTTLSTSALLSTVRSSDFSPKVIKVHSINTITVSLEISGTINVNCGAKLYTKGN